jgi:hypothetical protein
MQNREDWKLYNNEDVQGSNVKKDEMVSIEALAKLTGFPAQMIKAELFLGDMSENELIPLENLRSHMLKFLQRSLGKHGSDSEAV